MSNPVGRKDDLGKTRWELVPWEALTEVVQVLMAGSKKYDDHNWQWLPGLRTRVFAAGIRHMVQRILGEKRDKETGRLHSAHACCCLLFFTWRDLGSKNKGIDWGPDDD